MPGHYKKIMPAQQPIRARVLLLPYKNIKFAMHFKALTTGGHSRKLSERDRPQVKQNKQYDYTSKRSCQQI